MGRGVHQFDGGALRRLRTVTWDTEAGRFLTAARLAKLVGTSKAQILNYENGHCRPSSARVGQLARVLGCTPGLLIGAEQRPWQLGAFREAAGLTVAAAAKALDMSVNTYKRIERDGMLPKQRPEVLWQLAPLLLIDISTLLTFVRCLPEVQKRCDLVNEVVGPFVDGALLPGPLQGLPTSADEVKDLAALYQVSVVTFCDVVDVQLHALRTMASRRATLQMQMAYAPEQYAGRSYRAKVMTQRGQEIAELRRLLPDLIERCLAVNPLPATCWRLMGDLFLAGPGGLDLELVDRDALSILRRYYDGCLIAETLIGVALSPVGAMFAQELSEYYTAVYGDVGIFRQSRPQWSGVAAPLGAARLHSLRLAFILGQDPRPILTPLARVRQAIPRTARSNRPAGLEG